MRQFVHQQLPVVFAFVDHEHGQELALISQLIDAADLGLLAHADLVRDVGNPSLGRPGLNGDQVLRAAIIKQMNGFSYEVLAFHLADSMTYRAFCRIGVADAAPDADTLQRNVKRIRPQTWAVINHALMGLARTEGIESGEMMRGDCTVTDSNIHSPTDSSLLDDCVRVLTRLLVRAAAFMAVAFTNHRRRAHRRAIAIIHARRTDKRLPLYKDLLTVTERTVRAARAAAEGLRTCDCGDPVDRAAVAQLADELEHHIELAERVIDQTSRRVLQGESVPANEKVVSIFEPHTDIIRKDHRDTYYGHKIYLSSGPSGLITDCEILDGNPSDSKLTVDKVIRHQEIFGRVPRQVAFDGGFASRANLADLKELGVEDVCFSKGPGLAVLEMVRSSWVYRKLRNFRAGIEGNISFLKRVFGLDRCNWRGLESFKSYVWSSVVACNLLVMARQLMS